MSRTQSDEIGDDNNPVPIITIHPATPRLSIPFFRCPVCKVVSVGDRCSNSACNRDNIGSSDNVIKTPRPRAERTPPRVPNPPSLIRHSRDIKLVQPHCHQKTDDATITIVSSDTKIDRKGDMDLKHNSDEKRGVTDDSKINRRIPRRQISRGIKSPDVQPLGPIDNQNTKGKEPTVPKLSPQLHEHGSHELEVHPTVDNKDSLSPCKEDEKSSGRPKISRSMTPPNRHLTSDSPSNSRSVTPPSRQVPKHQEPVASQAPEPPQRPMVVCQPYPEIARHLDFKRPYQSYRERGLNMVLVDDASQSDTESSSSSTTEHSSYDTEVFIMEEPTCCHKCKIDNEATLPIKSCFILFKNNLNAEYVLKLSDEVRAGTTITIYNHTSRCKISIIGRFAGHKKRRVVLNPQASFTAVNCGEDGWFRGLI